ncbi:MAG TPA: EipA family protein, partial [Roseiarcus sp.]|nr:EipA family protein [Roseiarcus sp.]
MPNVTRRKILAGAAAGLGAFAAGAARADAPAPFSTEELVDSGHRFFGAISRGLAQVVEEATRRWGQPNGYILGQEASAAFVGGLRYGEGKMYTRNAGDQRVFWQGPSLGFDAGADGDRTMML